MAYGDGVILPGEAPESRVHLQQMCDGKVIARCLWEIGAPEGSAGVGFEFETGERLAVMALLVQEGTFLAKLIWRWIPAQQIWTKSMRKHHGADRHRAGEKPPDFLQRQIEGQTITGILVPKDHLGLGERLDIELRDTSRVILEAIPDLVANSADLDVRREHRKRFTAHA